MKITITNDGATILKAVPVENPAGNYHYNIVIIIIIMIMIMIIIVINIRTKHNNYY